MAQIVETPAGVINGINAVFTTSVPYQAGSLAVWINGQQVPPANYTETSPAAGTFTLTDPGCIPKSGGWGSDTISVDYNDPSTDAEIVEVDDLSCLVEDGGDPIEALVTDEDLIFGQVDDVPTDIQATVCDLDTIAAVVEDTTDNIQATVEDC